MVGLMDKSRFGKSEKLLVGAPNPDAYSLWKDEVQTLKKEKEPKADLRREYGTVFRTALILTLSMLIVTFQVARTVEFESEAPKEADVQIEVADIPQTEQVRRPPPPPRPAIPIPTEDESVPEDFTIESTEMDLTDVPPPPPMQASAEDEIFVAYDEAPQIVGGMAELLHRLDYPSVARKSGVECTVVAKVLVDKDGISKDVQILKVSTAGFGFEEKAIEALKEVNWKPAKQRDRNVSAWVAIPVKFQLTN